MLIRSDGELHTPKTPLQTARMSTARLFRMARTWASASRSSIEKLVGNGHARASVQETAPPEGAVAVCSGEAQEIQIGSVRFIVGRSPVDFSGFWSRVQTQTWEPETFALMSQLLSPGANFVDIGAWIGPTSLYAAALGARVDAYECDPVALSCLRTNLALNQDLAPRIAVHEVAVGETDGQSVLWSNALGNSESSFFSRHERDGVVADCEQRAVVQTCDALRVFRESGYADRDSTVVKIDVEGAEFSLIPRLGPLISESRAIWYVSFHELNLNPTTLPPAAVRVAEMLRVLVCFADLHWYGADLVELDKGATLEAIMNRTWPTHRSLVFTSRRLTD